MNTKKLQIFSDASFNPKTRTGICGYLLLLDLVDTIDIRTLPIKTKLYKNTNCTRLEVTSIILALNAAKRMGADCDITLYTDCKTACELPSRRGRLEERDFKSRKTGALLSNADLYLKFFKLFDELTPQIVWIKGHKRSGEKVLTDKIFSHIDKTTRKLLREVAA